MSDQTRAVIAAALALIVILGWGFFFKAPPPSQPQSGITVTQSTGGSTPSQSAVAPQQIAPASHVAAPATPAAPAAPVATASAEQSITIESDVYRVVLSNRGAVTHSWQLTKFTDEHTPPRTLDLV